MAGLCRRVSCPWHFAGCQSRPEVALSSILRLHWVPSSVKLPYQPLSQSGPLHHHRALIVILPSCVTRHTGDHVVDACVDFFSPLRSLTLACLLLWLPWTLASLGIHEVLITDTGGGVTLSLITTPRLRITFPSATTASLWWDHCPHARCWPVATRSLFHLAPSFSPGRVRVRVQNQVPVYPVLMLGTAKQRYATAAAAVAAVQQSSF